MRFLRGLGGYGIVELSQELLGDQTLPASTVFLENLQQVPYISPKKSRIR